MFTTQWLQVSALFADRFLKLVERVQAATEGARVRGRLRSRRLQAMIMEIKVLLST